MALNGDKQDLSSLRLIKFYFSRPMEPISKPLSLDYKSAAKLMMNFGLIVVVVGALFSSSHSFAIVEKKYQWSLQFKEDPCSVPEGHKNCLSSCI